MKNHKGKPVYTFEGCLAIIKSLKTYNARIEFATAHRDLFINADKLAKVLELLGNESAKFLDEQVTYWNARYNRTDESISVESIEDTVEEPAQKIAKPSLATMFKPATRRGNDNSDDRHHTRRNGHM